MKIAAPVQRRRAAFFMISYILLAFFSKSVRYSDSNYAIRVYYAKPYDGVRL